MEGLTKTRKTEWRYPVCCPRFKSGTSRILCIECLPFDGFYVGQAVGCRLLTAEARVLSRFSQCPNCGGQSDTGTGCSPVFCFPCQYHSAAALYSLRYHVGAGAKNVPFGSPVPWSHNLPIATITSQCTLTFSVLVLFNWQTKKLGSSGKAVTTGLKCPNLCSIYQQNASVDFI
jgi:hypothetical protein